MSENAVELFVGGLILVLVMGACTYNLTEESRKEERFSKQGLVQCLEIVKECSESKQIIWKKSCE